MAKKLRRAGGKTFPRYGLEGVTDRAATLAGKAIQGKLNAEAAAAALGMSKLSGSAKVKIAAAKHYGFLRGTYEEFEVTELCRDLANADGEERERLLQQAFLTPPLFLDVFTMYSGTQQSQAAIATLAVSKGVAETNKTKFAQVFVQGLVASALGEEKGDSIVFGAVPAWPVEAVGTEKGDEGSETADDHQLDGGLSLSDTTRPASISISIDSSLDPEKLEAHLAALRKYGLV